MDVLVKLNPWMPSSGNTMICTPCKTKTSKYRMLPDNTQHHLIPQFSFYPLLWRPASDCRNWGWRDGGWALLRELKSWGSLLTWPTQREQRQSSMSHPELCLGACQGRRGGVSLVERSRSLQANRRGLEFWVVQWEMGLIINGSQHWASPPSGFQPSLCI